MHKEIILSFTLCTHWAKNALQNKNHFSQLLVVGLNEQDSLNAICVWPWTQQTDELIMAGTVWTEPLTTKQTDETVTNFCHLLMNIPPWEFLCELTRICGTLFVSSVSVSQDSMVLLYQKHQ